jgi:hypothetical protein
VVQVYTGGLQRLKARDTNYQSGSADWYSGEIDCLLDCEAGTLQLINVRTRRTFRLVGMPTVAAVQGWTPHWNVSASVRLRVQALPVHRFGSTEGLPVAIKPVPLPTISKRPMLRCG